MRKYVPYIRTAEGFIERVSYAVYNSPDEPPAPYVHEQSISGWPESTVFWAKATGRSVGIAPLFSATPGADRGVKASSSADIATLLSPVPD
ncbi:hypothetical protein C8R31_101842 [Nitrosospira sp. Nsp2]|uniref:hypothetical protein n=1 Tax=Nitrosospira sp. Nsp2 TaxID=136548 RepID=UPI000D2FE654|nr:hypothetical protein [Nitrosospira sp. Nsp2]PTR17675.1 hypothetical protein C8R31_101842 [Nitrosospira sp. Nsp2]